jgi:hypothetical protein
MSGPAHAALEVGTTTTRLALAGPDRPIRMRRPTPAAGLPGFVRALLDEGWARVPGERGSIWVVTHESWYDGTVAGARAQDQARNALGDLSASWLSHVSAAGALAASRQDLDGPFLVCDAGAGGVTVARCEVTGSAIELRDVADDGRATPTAGGLAFTEALGATHGPALLEDLPLLLREQRRLTGEMLRRATSDPGYLEAPVYQSGVPEREYVVTAGELIEAFAPVSERLRTGIGQVMAGRTPVATVVTGAFGQFPLVEQTVHELTGVAPQVLGGYGAVEGALLIAAGEAQATPPDVPDVSVAVHRVKGGRLESHQVPLNPRSAPFALLHGAPLRVRGDAREFRLEVNGRPRTVVPPALPAGDYRIGLRNCRSGPGVLVFQPEHGDPIFLPLSAE